MNSPDRAARGAWTRCTQVICVSFWIGGCSAPPEVGNASEPTDGGSDSTTAANRPASEDAIGFDESSRDTALDATLANNADTGALIGDSSGADVGTRVDGDSGPPIGPDATMPDGGRECIIGGTAFASGAANLNNGCQTCQPDASATQWTGVSSGPGCSSSASCVIGRTCEPTCDELTENGVHEYIEMAPDDGSPLPPSNVADLFNGTVLDAGEPPCVTEPQDGALFPNNWLRPGIAYTAPSGDVYFQIRIHADRQNNDLVVYTGSKTWRIPNDIWAALAASTWGEDITITVSAVGAAGGVPATATPVRIQIAPAKATGSIVYLAVVGDENGGFSWLEGFRVGDDNVSQLLTVDQVQERMFRDVGGNLQIALSGPPAGSLPNGPGSVQCIGCHAAVPDGVSMAFHDFYPWPGAVASITTADAGGGAVPSWFTPGGQEALALPWLGMMTFSRSAWQTGQHWAVAGLQLSQADVPWQGGGSESPSSLVWIDLSTRQPLVFGGPDGGPAANLAGENATFVSANLNKSYGYIARTGDPGPSASCPTWSHDGRDITYVSNNAAQDGFLAVGTADLYTVPFNGGMGGTASPVAGASDPSVNEYYPWYSPDDEYIAFNRAPSTDSMYYNSQAEVNVVPSGGGTAMRLAANDPPACLGVTSPGVTNSWARWSPTAPTCGGITYYWLVFSSTRGNVNFNAANMKAGDVETTSHLYVTALMKSSSGALTSYPGIYVWNQPTLSSDFPGSGGQPSPQSDQMPSWDLVDIAPPPPAP